MRFIYKYTDKEIQNILKSAIVVCDTREQKNSHITDYFTKKNIPFTHEKLDFGDYTIKIEAPTAMRDFYLDDICVIERKASLNELSGNLAHERERIEREFMRAKGKVFLLVENAKYEDIRQHKYDTQYTPKAFMGTLKTFEARHNIIIKFMQDASYSGDYIYTTLIYHLREALKEGLF